MNLPSSLNYLREKYYWEAVTLGMSDTAVYKLTAPTEQSLFIKTGRGVAGAELVREGERLRWLNGRLPVSRIVHFVQEDEVVFLVSMAVLGHDFTFYNDKSDVEKETAVKLMAEGLRMLHQLPIVDCPFDERLDNKIERARQWMVAGLVDETEFDAVRQGRTAESLFAELLATRPQAEDLVFTHGDYCLPNALVHGDGVSGFVDLSLAGVADRYQDLALVTRSLTYNFGTGWEEKLFAYYGIAKPDVAKIAFYRLLDEFA